MGRKGGKYNRKEHNDLVKKKSVQWAADDDDMINDEIDAFHKKRDVVPLNINKDMEESDEDEQPVFDFENDDDDEDVDNEDDEDRPPNSLAAKIARTQKYLRAKFGGIEDEILDDADEEEEQERVVWGRKKEMYGADVDYEPQSSDDEDAAEEEAEVLRLEREKAKTLTLADFGLEDASQDDSDQEPTFEELQNRGKPTSKASVEKGVSYEDGTAYEVIKKDLNALTKEEQMDVVYSSAPELVGLLSELNDAIEQLENKVNPFVEKIGECESANGGMHFMKIKQLLLQSYCQTITFYLLLKSEGHPVRDHPVIPRLVEIKTLLDKVKEIEKNLPFSLEDLVNKVVINKIDVKSVQETVARLESDPLTDNQISLAVSSEKTVVEPKKVAEPTTSRGSKNTESGCNNKDKKIGSQSTQMLKIRESLEEKLRQKGVLSSITQKNVRSRGHLQTANGQLETLDDFVDETMEIDGLVNGKSNRDVEWSNSSKLSQQLTRRTCKRKVVSGDDDIPKRDDIGERRRKHELQVLAGAGFTSVEDGDNVEDEAGNLSSDGAENVDDESDADSDLEYYKQVEQQRAAKLAAKSEKYSRTPQVPSLPETADGKREITHQMEKNRGLTRARKKLTKNPRKKYKLKHKKAEIRRKGQVREIRKPTGPYGGESTGINAGISRSIRIKS